MKFFPINSLYLYCLGFTGGKVLKDKSNEELENTTNDLLNQTAKPHVE